MNVDEVEADGIMMATKSRLIVKVVKVVGCRMSNVKCQMSDSGCRISDV